MNILEYINKKNNNLKNLIRTVKNDFNTIQSLTELNNSNNYDSYIKIQNNLIQQYGGADYVLKKDGKGHYFIDDNNKNIYLTDVSIPEEFKDSKSVGINLAKIQDTINKLRSNKDDLDKKVKDIRMKIKEIKKVNEEIIKLKTTIDELNTKKTVKIQEEKVAKKAAENKKADDNIKLLDNSLETVKTNNAELDKINSKAESLFKARTDEKNKLDKEKNKLEEELKKLQAEL